MNDVINWYPGHMKKTVSLIESKIKDIDFYIELVDARCPIISSNPELNNLFKNKIKICIAVKSDLVKEHKTTNDILYISTHNHRDKQKVIKYINDCCKPLIQSKQKKGYVNINLIGIVVGLPNIGKSSLINFLLEKKQLIVKNQPGVTKKISNLKINNQITLFDTPGVFLKKVSDFNVGAILTLIGSVDFKITNKYKVIECGYNFFIKNHFELISKHYKLTNKLTFDSFLNHICETKKFKLKENENDYERCFDFLYSEFLNSKIGLIKYE